MVQFSLLSCSSESKEVDGVKVCKLYAIHVVQGRLSESPLHALLILWAVKTNKLRLRENWLIFQQWPWEAPYDQIKDCKYSPAPLKYRYLGCSGVASEGLRSCASEIDQVMLSRPMYLSARCVP